MLEHVFGLSKCFYDLYYYLEELLELQQRELKQGLASLGVGEEYTKGKILGVKKLFRDWEHYSKYEDRYRAFKDWIKHLKEKIVKLEEWLAHEKNVVGNRLLGKIFILGLVREKIKGWLK